MNDDLIWYAVDRWGKYGWEYGIMKATFTVQSKDLPSSASRWYATSYTFSPVTGKYTLTYDKYLAPNQVSTNTTYYAKRIISSWYFWTQNKETSEEDELYPFRVTGTVCQTTEKWTKEQVKKEPLLGYVYGNSAKTPYPYPDNGMAGDYWYVKNTPTFSV